MIRITKKFDFEAGHALFGYDGKCKNLHGHSYKLYVTVIGEPINNPHNVKNGMVIDFGDLKRIVQEQIIDAFDHAMVFNELSSQSLSRRTPRQGASYHYRALSAYQRKPRNRLCSAYRLPTARWSNTLFYTPLRNRKFLCRMVCIR